MGRTGKRAWGAVVLGAMTGVAGFGLSPARGQCLEAVVYVTRQGDSPTYVYGEHDPCITNTPWNHGVTYQEELTRTGLPQGTPNGYWIRLRVPAP